MCLLTVCLFLALSLFSPLTQGESVAIIAPAGGQTVSGLVLVSGSAESPQFQRYELDFGYEPNPTDTWFPIQDPVLTPQPGGLLGQWDTVGQGIADGVYTLRVRLYRADGSVVEAFVHAIAVQNGSPSAAAPSADTTPATTPATETPTATGVFVELPPSSTPRPTTTPRGVPAAAPSRLDSAVRGPTFSRTTFARAFVTGIGWAFGAFALMGLYAFVRPLVRPRLRQWIRRLLKPR